MNYPISSSTLANPLLIALLKELVFCFNKAGKEFFIIGAVSRDILRLYIDHYSEIFAKVYFSALTDPNFL